MLRPQASAVGAAILGVGGLLYVAGAHRWISSWRQRGEDEDEFENGLDRLFSDADSVEEHLNNVLSEDMSQRENAISLLQNVLTSGKRSGPRSVLCNITLTQESCISILYAIEVLRDTSSASLPCGLQSDEEDGDHIAGWLVRNFSTRTETRSERADHHDALVNMSMSVQQALKRRRSSTEMIVNQADTAVDGPARQSQSEEQAQKSHEGAGSVQQQEGSGSRRESDAALASHKETTAAPKAGLLSYMLDPNDVDDSQGFEPFEHEEDEVVRNLLSDIDTWEFDIKQLSEAVGGQPLRIVGWHLLNDKWDFVSHFRLNPGTVRKWLAFVEDTYVASNPYHSSVHAADVTQAVHWMLKVGGGSEFLSKFECLAVLLSAMAHDMGHDGLNNAFHKATVSQRAIEHNDQSIQENYHVSLLFGAMAKDPSINIFKRFDPHRFLEMRSLIITIVLCTDMNRHFDLVLNFKNLVSAKGATPENWSDDTAMILQMILHCADISAQSRSLSLAKWWCSKCMDEFFLQGDMEKSMGLPVSHLCDRFTANVPAGQVGFIKFIVAPTFHATSLLLHKMTGTVNASLDHNMAYWKRLEDTQKRISDSKIALGFGKKFGGGLASQRGSSRSLTGSAGSNGGSSSNLTKSFKKSILSSLEKHRQLLGSTVPLRRFSTPRASASSIGIQRTGSLDTDIDGHGVMSDLGPLHFNRLWSDASDGQICRLGSAATTQSMPLPLPSHRTMSEPFDGAPNRKQQGAPSSSSPIRSPQVQPTTSPRLIFSMANFAMNKNFQGSMSSLPESSIKEDDGSEGEGELSPKSSSMDRGPNQTRKVFVKL